MASIVLRNADLVRKIQLFTSTKDVYCQARTSKTFLLILKREEGEDLHYDFEGEFFVPTIKRHGLTYYSRYPKTFPQALETLRLMKRRINSQESRI